MVAYQFPNFMVNNVTLKYVTEFKYLGHVVSISQLDDADIHRERKNLFHRCNILMRRFSKCSVAVKLQLFKTFCLCFLANVNSRSRSLYAIGRPSVVCRLSVCL